MKHHFQNRLVNEKEKETSILIKHVNKPLTKNMQAIYACVQAGNVFHKNPLKQH
jgi:hypothetical protein